MKRFLYFIFPLFLMLLPVDFFAENSVFLKFSLDGEFPVNNTDFNIVTKEVIDITCCSAVSGGIFSSTDEAEIKSKGLCWSIQSQPTIEDSKVFSEGTDGDFSVEITNLKANTVYYVRSFVLINKVYYYGDEKEFSTLFKLPTISFSKLGLITDSSFYFESNASDDGGDEITEKGFCFSKLKEPTVWDDKISNGKGLGVISGNALDLMPSTVYFAKAYAISSVGVVYGDEIELITAAKSNIPEKIVTNDGARLAKLETELVEGVTQNEATISVTIKEGGGTDIFEKGVCWAESSSPTINGTKQIEGSGEESFTSIINGLNPSTRYYLRSYAINDKGVAYGNQIIINTKSIIVESANSDSISLAIVIGEEVTLITNKGAVSGGVISSDGGSEITEKGICWSQSTAPSVGDSKNNEGVGNSAFKSEINSLLPSTKYFVRAYVINSVGVAYGEEFEFVTLSPEVIAQTNTENTENSAETSENNSSEVVKESIEPSLPVIKTNDITSITQTSALSGAVILTEGSTEITEKGICWSQSTAPSVYDSKNNEGLGNSAFNSEINSLLPSTKYFVRAYVINSVGVAYGEEFEFVTLSPEVIAQTNTENTENSAETSENNSSEVIKESVEPYLPVIKTNDITSITQTSALSGAIILTEGSTEITEKGICWSQSTAPSVYDSKNNEGVGNSAFNSEINSLLPSTKYFVRAYVITSVGVAYGDELEFVTLSPEVIAQTNTENSDEINKNDESSLDQVELLTTVKDELTTELSASISCEILRGAELIFSEKGVCWSKKELPTLDSNKKTEDVDLSYFSVLISDLEPNSLYFVRSYVVFEGKVFYGNQQQFKTLPLTTIPSVSTGLISKINEKSAFSSGQVLLDGGSTLIEKGVCYSFNQMPTIDGDKVIAENELDKFNCSLENLLTNTTYYVRAYAINSLGVAYGNQVRFATLNPVFSKVSSDAPATSLPKKNPQVIPKPSLTKSLPSILTLKEDLLTHSSFRIQGKLTSDGGNFISERGVCISNSSKGPVLSSVKTQDTDNDVFSVEFVGLKPSVKYYARAYVKNETGIFYGNELVVLTNKKPILDIGSNHEGGVVGYIFQPEDKGYVKGEIHGLIVAREDQGKASWGCVQKSIPEAINKFIGAGKQNTDSISTFCTDDYFAAKLSADLDLNSYDDWYLPSIDELTRIYHNRDKIGGFNNAIYWSSSEKSNHKAIGYVFSYGVVYANYKYSTGYVRSVRTF